MVEKKRKKKSDINGAFGCSRKHPEKCGNAEVKTNIITNTAYVIITTSLVAAFAFVFALAISDGVKVLIGDIGIVVNLIIMFALLLVMIYVLIVVQNNKKQWETEAEKRKIVF